MYCASGSSYSEFSESIKTCQNLTYKTMPPQLLICAATSTGPRMVGIWDLPLKKYAKMVRKKSAYQRKARHYWPCAKKYAVHPPIRNRYRYASYQPGRLERQNVLAGERHVDMGIPITGYPWSSTSLITDNRGCVIPKRVINVYRNVYRIYFRTRQCAFITGLVACCIVPFAAPIYLHIICLPFLLYLIFYIILIQALQTFRNRRNTSPFFCK